MTGTSSGLLQHWRSVLEPDRDAWLSSIADAILAGRTPADDVLSLLVSKDVLRSSAGDRRAAVDGLWLAEEIGSLAQPLLPDMISLAGDADEVLRWCAIQALAHYAGDWRSVGAMLRIFGWPYVRRPPPPHASAVTTILRGLEDPSVVVSETAAVWALPMVPIEGLRAGRDALIHHPTHAAGLAMLLAPSLEPRVEPDRPPLLILYWIAGVLRLPKGAERERCRHCVNELTTHPNARVREAAVQTARRLE